MLDNDIQQGATDDEQQQQSGEETPKTYTKEELDAAIADAKAEAKREGESNAFRHWQSVHDKQMAEATKSLQEQNAALQADLAAREKAAMDAMSPEDRQRAIMEKMWEKMNQPQDGAKSASPQGQSQTPPKDQGQPQYQEPDVAAAQKQVRESVGAILKSDFGIDPTKVDWAEDTSGPEAMRRFLKSVREQMGGEGAKKPEGEGKDGDDDVNRVSTSHGSTAAPDVKDIDPGSLIRSGYGKVVRGNMQR